MKVIEEYKVHPQTGEVGIEVEMEGNNLWARSPTMEKWWSVTTDGSLRGEAYEYRLTRPITHTEVAEAVVWLYDMFRTSRCRLNPTDRAGVHIHFNVQTYEFQEVMNLVLLYLILEDSLINFCGESRRGNQFCMTAGDAEAMIYALHTAALYGTFSGMTGDAYRYASLNITALRKFGSLEFRAMHTPISPEPIVVWHNLLHRIKTAATRFKTGGQIIETVSELGAEPFARNILGNLLPEVRYPDLEDTIWAGVRRVQHIAYTAIDKTHPVAKPIRRRAHVLNPDAREEFPLAPMPGVWAQRIPPAIPDIRGPAPPRPRRARRADRIE